MVGSTRACSKLEWWVVKYKWTVRCATSADRPTKRPDVYKPNKDGVGFLLLLVEAWADGIHIRSKRWLIPPQPEHAFVAGLKLIPIRNRRMIEPIYVLSIFLPPHLNFPRYKYFRKYSGGLFFSLSDMLK